MSARTTRFVVEFRSRQAPGTTALLPSLNAIDTLSQQTAEKMIETALTSGAADEAVLYVPVKLMAANRTVSSIPIGGNATPQEISNA